MTSENVLLTWSLHFIRTSSIIALTLKLRDVGAIAEEMANEAQNAERDRHRNRPVINQFCEFIGQALLQHNAYVSIATDLAGSWTGNTGSLKFDLSKMDEHDIVGACIAQAEKTIKQQAEASQPGSIGISTPATSAPQTSTSTLMMESVQDTKPAASPTTAQQPAQTGNASVDSSETVLMLAPATLLSEN